MPVSSDEPAWIGVGAVEPVFGREFAGRHAAHPGAGGDDQRPVRAGERAGHCLDRALILLAIRHEMGEVVVEGGVDHGIRLRGAARKTVRLLERAAMDLRAGLFELARASVGAS